MVILHAVNTHTLAESAHQICNKLSRYAILTCDKTTVRLTLLLQALSSDVRLQISQLFLVTDNSG
ncbi:hypothetical protein ACK1H7_004873, partial [Salmonella enterica]